VDVLLTLVVVLTVSGPLLFTNSGFARDFTNAMWMAWAAGRMSVEAGHPAFFLNTTSLGVFYPLFAFYGGSLYTATGVIAELLAGHIMIAFAGVTMLAIAGTYGGVLWLGRMFGVRGLAAHAPALVVVTSAYYITDLYGRGAWAEFMVTSAIAPLLASGVHLLRAAAWRPLPIAIFIVSAAIFTGGHNITLLWGSAVMAGALLTLWLALRAPLRLPYRRLAMLGGLGLASTLLNAWFLLPDLAYAGKVAIAHSVPSASTIWTSTREFNSPGVLLDPLRLVPRKSTTPALFLQAPVWFMAWGLLAAALLMWRRALTGVLRRIWVGALVVLVSLLAMLMIEQFWQLVQYPFNEIQFPYRLSSYLAYATGGLVLVAVLALQRVAAREAAGRTVNGLRGALIAVVVISLALCLWQLWVPNTLLPESYSNRNAALASVNVAPGSWASVGDYDEWQAKILTVPRNRTLLLVPGAVAGDRFAAWMNAPPGPAPIQTNIAGGPYLVHLSGLRLVGRNSEDLAVVKRLNGGAGPVHVVVETTHGTVVELGRILSLTGLFAVLAVLSCAAVRTRRWPHVRRRERSVPGVV
jgi:hypothetical protein